MSCTFCDNDNNTVYTAFLQRADSTNACRVSFCYDCLSAMVAHQGPTIADNYGVAYIKPPVTNAITQIMETHSSMRVVRNTMYIGGVVIGAMFVGRVITNVLAHMVMLSAINAVTNIVHLAVKL